MQDRPTAAELLQALSAFLRGDLLPALDGRLRFHTMVAANVVDILRREWELGALHREEDLHGLVAILGHDGDEEALLRELAAAIRSGALDGRMAEVVPFLHESVRRKCQVASPRHLR